MKNTIKKYDLICKNGKSWNEDYAFLGNGYGFVLDGASNVTGEHFSSCETDAKWFAQEFGKFLESALKDYSKSIVEIMKDGIVEVTEKYHNLTNHKKIVDMPSSCVSAFRLNQDNTELEYFVLGDSGIAINKNGKINDIIDLAVTYLDKVDLESMKKISTEKNISVLKARKFIDKQMLKKRLTKNTPNGYWILGDDVKACDNALYGKIKIEKGDLILLYTDGFSQIWNTIFIHSLSDVFSLLNSGKSLENLYQELYDEQEKDAECNKFPRFKKRDDASAIYLKF